MRVVNPYDVAFRKAKSAVGAATLLEQAEEYRSVAEAVADCTLVVGTTAVRHRELQHPLRRLEYGALDSEANDSSRVALLWLREVRALAARSQPLPLVDENSHAGRAHLNEPGTGRRDLFVRTDSQSAAAGTSEKLPLAPSEEVERMTKILLDVLSTSTHMTPDRAPATEERVRRMVRRLKVSARDAEAWLGIFRQILWEIRHGKRPSQ